MLFFTYIKDNNNNILRWKGACCYVNNNNNNNILRWKAAEKSSGGILGQTGKGFSDIYYVWRKSKSSAEKSRPN